MPISDLFPDDTAASNPVTASDASGGGMGDLFGGTSAPTATPPQKPYEYPEPVPAADRSGQTIAMPQSPDQPYQPPYTSPAPQSPGASLLNDATGIPAKAVQTAEGAMGGALALGGKAQALLPQPVQSALKVPESFVEKFGELEPYLGENEIKGLISKMQGTGWNAKSWQDILSDTPGIKNLPPETLKNLGIIAEPVLDPALMLKPLGLTAKGLDAAKADELAGNLGAKASQGQQALLAADVPGLGRKTLVGGQPILKGMSDLFGAAQKAPVAGDLIRSFSTKTGDQAFDRSMEDFNNKESYSNRMASERIPAQNRIIEGHAALQGVDPQEIKQRILEYNEPVGSQQPEANWNNILNTKQQSLDQLQHGGVQDLAKQYENESKNFPLTPGEAGKYDTRSNYFKHKLYPDLEKYMDDFTPPGTREKYFGTAGKAPTIRRKGGGLSDLDITTANKLGQAGKITDIPYFSQAPEFKGYTGKVFDDDVVGVAANRWLESQRVNNRYDLFNSVGKSHGITRDEMDEMVANGQAKRRDYFPINNDAFEGDDKERYFPKEVGMALDKINNPTKLQEFARQMNNFTKYVQAPVKLVNFGIMPASIGKIEVGNQFNAWARGLWSPLSQLQGHNLAEGLRMGHDMDQPFIKTNEGVLTKKQVLDEAKRYGGIGMGQATFETGDKSWQQKLPTIQGHNFVEDGTRLGTYIEARKQGYNPPAAGRITKETQYNYSELSDADQVARTIVPFYTFMRKNLPNQLENLIKEPAKMAALPKLRDAINGTKGKEEQENEPDYMVQNMPIRAGSLPNGEEMYWYLNRFIPETDLNEFLANGRSLGEMAEKTPAKMLQTGYGELNPVPRALADIGFNKNPITQGDLERMEDQVSPSLGGVNVPTFVEHLLRQLSPYSKERMLENPNMTPSQKALNIFPGINEQEYDPARAEMEHYQQLSQQMRKDEEDLRYWLKRSALDQGANKKDQASADDENAGIAQKHFMDAIEQMGK